MHMLLHTRQSASYLSTAGRSICSYIPDSPPQPCHQQAGAYAPAYQTDHLILVTSRQEHTLLHTRQSTSALSHAGSFFGELCHKLWTQSSAPEDGRNYRPKHVELIEITNKLLLLNLVGCLYCFIIDARSHKHKKEPKKLLDPLTLEGKDVPQRRGKVPITSP